MKQIELSPVVLPAPAIDVTARGPIILGGITIAVFFGVFGVWAMLAPLDGAAIAAGQLQVADNRQSVQHPHGGVVTELLVKEGDEVRQGQVLLRLDDTEPRAQLAMLESQRDGLEALAARLNAEIRGTEAPPAFGVRLLGRRGVASADEAMTNQEAVFRERKRQHDVETQILKQRIAQLEEQIRGGEAQIAGNERQRDLLEQEAVGVRKLLASGLTTTTRMLALDRSAAELDANRGARLADVAKARQAIGEAELEIHRAARRRVTDATDQLRDTEGRLAELAPRIEAARNVFARSEVRAPAAGAVVGLAIFTKGGVVQPGARLLDIVPSGGSLIVEARLPLRDIDRVRPGHAADIRLTGLDPASRPRLHGRVGIISADRMTDDRTGERYYGLQVQINPESLRESRIAPRPGMAADVLVVTTPRTLFNYLIGPLSDEISGAFRER